MIENLRVTMLTVDGRKVRLDIKPKVALELARSIIRELDGRIENVVAALSAPPEKARKKARAA